jgi:hypothetical protein
MNALTTDAARVLAITWQIAVELHPLPPGLAADPRRGLIGTHHGTGAHGRGDRDGGGQQRRLGAGQDVGDGTLTDAHAEHLGHQPGEALKADRLGDMKMDDQRT